MPLEQAVIVVLLTAAVVPFSFCPYSFLFQSSFLSAVQPHSISSSLSSVELVSASDDIHRFSAQVLYSPNSEHLCLQGHAKLLLSSACTDSMRMSTDQSLQDFTNIFCALVECLLWVFTPKSL